MNYPAPHKLTETLPLYGGKFYFYVPENKNEFDLKETYGGDNFLFDGNIAGYSYADDGSSPGWEGIISESNNFSAFGLMDINKDGTLSISLPKTEKITFTFTPKVKLPIKRFKITLTNTSAEKKTFSLFNAKKQAGIQVKYGQKQLSEIRKFKRKVGLLVNNISFNSKKNWKDIQHIVIYYKWSEFERGYDQPTLYTQPESLFHLSNPYNFGGEPVILSRSQYLNKAATMEITIPPGTYTLTFNEKKK